MHTPTPQLFQLADQFPELLRDPRGARVAFFQEILAEGPSEIMLAAQIWDIEAPAYLRGESRLQYLAGKVAEAEFPLTHPIVVDAA